MKDLLQPDPGPAAMQRRLRLKWSVARLVVRRAPSRNLMNLHRLAVLSALSFCLVGGARAQIPVEVSSVESRSIVRQLNVNGTVTSPRTAVLSTAVAGLVAQLDLDEGDRVAQGDPLLMLDPELAQLALDRTLAQVRQREAELADAERRLSQAREVGAERGIARSEIESLEAEVVADEATLAAARVAASEQRALLKRHTLAAPFGGVVSRRLAELGEWVNPGDGLLELVATDGLRFDFQVGQDFYAALSAGAAIEITVDALPDQRMTGTVSTIVPVKDITARTFLVRVLADSLQSDQPLRLTPGMSARGRLAISTGRQGLAVSRDAILRFPDGRVTVWVLERGGEDNTVREQLIATGLEFDGMVEITAGLSGDELVVTRGNETLLDGQKVSIVAEGS